LGFRNSQRHANYQSLCVPESAGSGETWSGFVAWLRRQSSGGGRMKNKRREKAGYRWNLVLSGRYNLGRLAILPPDSKLYQVGVGDEDITNILLNAMFRGLRREALIEAADICHQHDPCSPAEASIRALIERERGGRN
jgi:hypothetical protein